MITRETLALLLALCVPASAAAQAADKPAEPPKPQITIYGNFNANLQWTDARGATNHADSVKSRLAVSIDSTHVGVRAAMPLRDWLQAVAQCETGASINGLSLASFCNRNSRVGLSSDKYGTLFYGNWDTPYKSMAGGTKADDPFMTTDVWDFASIVSSPGFNYRSGGWSTASDSAIIGFDIRANNAVAYFSPRWFGVSFKALYAADTFKNATGTRDPTLYSFVVNYDGPKELPLSAAVACERHDDGFALAGINPASATTRPFGATAANTAGTATAAIHSRDTACRADAGYQLDWAAGATTLSAMAEQLRLEQSNAPFGAIEKYQRNAGHVALKHRFGGHELRLRYSLANDGTCVVNGVECDTSGYGARMIAAGYAYYLAANAQVYLHYGKIINSRNAQYTFSIGGSSAVAGATPRGADPQALGLGMRYSF